MSILKFETRTPRTLRGMYNYLLDPTKTSEEGIFTIGCNPRFAVEEFEFVQKVYLREQLTHPYLQVIFSFDKNTTLPLYVIKEISMKIGLTLILDRRQVFAAIHYLGKAAQKIHCHYIINYVSVDGALYSQTYSLRYYKKKVNDIIIPYGLKAIKMFDVDENLQLLA